MKPWSKKNIMYRKEELFIWLGEMNDKKPIHYFNIEFRANPNKVSILWDQLIIVFDQMYIPFEISLTHFIHELEKKSTTSKN